MGSGRLVLAGLMAVLGFMVQLHAADLAGRWLAGAPRSATLLADLGGVVGWLALAALGVAAFDLAIRRAAAQPPRLLQDMARLLLYGGAVPAILSFVFGLPVTGLVTTSGVMVAVIGFALRNMIADVFSGIALNLERPYRIGDWIEVAPSLVGRVAEINWRATRLETRDRTSVVVPNGLIAGSRLVNYSQPERSYRATVRLALSAAVPVARAKRVLMAGLLGAGRILAAPRPEVQVEAIDDRGVVYLLRYWVPDYADDNPCRDAVMASVLRCLAQAGLSPALPHREIMLRRREVPAPTLRDELHHVPLFENFDDRELDALAAQAVPQRFREGVTLVAAGEPGSSLFVLTEGVVDVTVATPRGTPLVVDRLLPGDVFGEVSLLTGCPRSATVTAATDGMAYEVRKEHVEPILKARPALAEELAELMARRRRANRERVDATERSTSPDPGEVRLLRDRVRAFFGL
jgi:small-conductance mechanosensitive channel/CRP-like cAMP-binding protein